MNDILNGGNSVANISRAANVVDGQFLPRFLLGLIKRNPCPSPESTNVIIEILDDHCSLKPSTIDTYAIRELFQLLDIPLTNTILHCCMDVDDGLVDVLPVIPMNDSIDDVIDILLTNKADIRSGISEAIRGNKYLSHDEFMGIYDRARAKKVLLGEYFE